MKMTDTRYQLLKSGIKRVIDRYGMAALNVDVVNPVQTLWKLFHHVTADFLYDDTHPRYQNLERINDHIPGFKIYKDDNGVELFDNHIKTALMKIGKELGIL